MRTGVLVLLAAISVGCAQQDYEDTAAIEGATTAVAFNTAGAPTVEFDVPDMMCPEGCGAKVKEILSQQPGAREVVIDFDSKTAIVAVDQDRFDSDAALAALVDHSFDHSQLKAPATTEPATN